MGSDVASCAGDFVTSCIRAFVNSCGRSAEEIIQGFA